MNRRRSSDSRPYPGNCYTERKRHNFEYSEGSSSLTDAAYATEVQFFYSATNGSDTGSVVAAVVGNEATANLSDLLPATTYTVYGVVTATNGSTPQSSSTTFTTEGARTDHAAWYELPAKDNAGSNMLLRTFYDTARNYTMYTTPRPTRPTG